jgi:hypothetical protein
MTSIDFGMWKNQLDITFNEFNSNNGNLKLIPVSFTTPTTFTGNILEKMHQFLYLVHLLLTRQLGILDVVSENDTIEETEGAIDLLLENFEVVAARFYPRQMSQHWDILLSHNSHFTPKLDDEQPSSIVNFNSDNTHGFSRYLACFVWIKTMSKLLRDVLEKHISRKSKCTLKEMKDLLIGCFDPEFHSKICRYTSYGFIVHNQAVNSQQEELSIRRHGMKAHLCDLKQKVLQLSAKYVGDIEKKRKLLISSTSNSSGRLITLENNKIQTIRKKLDQSTVYETEMVFRNQEIKREDHERFVEYPHEGLEKLTFDSCVFDPSENKWKEHFGKGSPHRNLRKLVFRNMSLIPVSIISCEYILNQIECLEFENCGRLDETCSGSINLKSLQALCIRNCPEMFAKHFQDLVTLKSLRIDRNCKISHLLRQSSESFRLEELRLIDCEASFIYKTLHSKHHEQSLVRSLKTLALSWSLYQTRPNTSKQIHLNRFSSLRTLTLKNYYPDTICTRNRNHSIKTLELYTRNLDNIRQVSKFVSHDARTLVYMQSRLR